MADNACYNCSTVANCETCGPNGLDIICLSCSDLYVLNGDNTCEPDCGDGVMVADE